MVNIPAPPPLAQTASAKEEISSQDFDQLQQQLQDIKEQVTEAITFSSQFGFVCCIFLSYVLW